MDSPSFSNRPGTFAKENRRNGSSEPSLIEGSANFHWQRRTSRETRAVAASSLCENRLIFRRALPKGVGSRFRHSDGSHYGSFSWRNRLPTPFTAKHPLAVAGSWTGLPAAGPEPADRAVPARKEIRPPARYAAHNDPAVQWRENKPLPRLGSRVSPDKSGRQAAVRHSGLRRSGRDERSLDPLDDGVEPGRIADGEFG